MSAIKSLSFDGRVVMYDTDMDITIAVEQHRFGQDILYRECSVDGNLIAQFVPSLQHGLNELQLGISNTAYGQTWHLFPTSVAKTKGEGRNALEAFTRLQGNSLEVAKALFIRVPLATRGEIVEMLAKDLGPGQFVDNALVNMIPHQGRGAMILDKSLTPEAVESSDCPELAFGMKRFDAAIPEAAPEGLENYGLPAIVLATYNMGPSAFRKLMEEWPCSASHAMDLADEKGLGCHGQNGFLATCGNRELTYEMVSQAISYEYSRTQEALETWEMRHDAMTQAETLGALVESLADMRQLESRDARNRPELCHVPMSEEAFGEFEEEVLERALLQSSTPRDTVQRMGELTPFSDAIPYFKALGSKEADDFGRLSGHPFAWLIELLMNALRQPLDEQLLGVKNTEFCSVVGFHDNCVDYIEDGVSYTSINGRVAKVASRNGDRATLEIAIEAPEKVVLKVRQKDLRWLPPKGEGVSYKVGDKILFGTQAEMVLFRATYTRVNRLVWDNGLMVNELSLPDVFPELFQLVCRSVGEYLDGAGVTFNEIDEEFEASLLAVSREYSQSQKEAMETLVKANYEAFFTGFDMSLQDAYSRFIEDPANFNSQAEYSSLVQTAWQTLFSMTEEEFVCPPGKAYFMWNLLGYTPGDGVYSKGKGWLLRMVQEQLLHVHTSESSSQREYRRSQSTGKNERKMVRKPLTKVVLMGNGTGKVGEQLAEFWRITVGLQIPSAKKNFFMMTREEGLNLLDGNVEAWKLLREVPYRKSLRENQAWTKELEKLLGSHKMAILTSPAPSLLRELLETAVNISSSGEQMKRAFASAIETQEVGSRGKELLKMILLN